MFEFLYAGKIIELIEKNPREIIGGIVAVVALTEIGSHITKVKVETIKAEAAVKSEEIKLECEKIRLETARVEAQNRPA